MTKVISLAKKINLWFLTILLVIILDQLLKNIVVKFVSVYCNKGLFFGLFGFSYNQLIILTVLVMITYSSLRSREVFTKYGLALILGGGISNFIDRLTVGCVRDFISIGYFPNFNPADAAISLGVILMILGVFYKKGSTSKHEI